MLKKVRVLEQFEGDILVEYHSKKGEVFLEKWADFDYAIMAKTTPEKIESYLRGEIPLNDILMARPKIILVDKSTPTLHFYKEVSLESLPRTYLAKDEAYHDVELRPEDF